MKTSDPQDFNLEDIQMIITEGLKKSDNAVILTSEDEKILYVNDVFHALTGYETEEVIGKRPSFQQGEKTDPEEKSRLRKAMRRREKILSEIINYTRDGSDYWCELTIVPHSAGNKNFFLGLKKDITERKLWELEMEEENRKLRGSVLVARKMIALIAHDLRSPITGLDGSLEYLHDDLPNMDCDDYREYIDLLHTSARSVRLLVDNILNWATKHEDDFTMEWESVPIRDLVEDVINLYMLPAGRKGIEIQNDIDPDLVLYLDRHMLHAVVRNLISNAVKYTPNNGRVSLESEITGEGTLIRIVDTGRGLFDNCEEHELTEELLETVSRKGKSPGLGLFMCRDFMVKLNGKILLSKNSSGGTTAILLFREGPVHSAW